LLVLGATLGLTAALAGVALAASPDAISQLVGKAGCISQTGSKGECTKGRGLSEANGVAVSPDGRNVYVAAPGSNSVAIFDRDPADGHLRQPPGRAGCIARGGSDCAHARAIGQTEGVAVSPDGRNVYAIGYTLGVYDRDPATGALEQKKGHAGCFARLGARGACTPAPGLGIGTSVAISPDGRFLYAGSFAGIAVFERDPRTGALRQPPGPDGCVIPVGRNEEGCGRANGIDYPQSLVVSPDGRDLYTANFLVGSVAIFKRDPQTGAIAQLPGTAGCIAQEETGDTCRDGRALRGATSIAVSPDGRSVYATGQEEGGLAIFRRDRSTGALTQPHGPAGCVTERGLGPHCKEAIKMFGPLGVAVSPDNRAVYVVGGDLIAIFRRDRQSGALTQLPGKAGCIADNGSEGKCENGAGLNDGFDLAVSPDGRNVYGVSIGSSAVTVFGR
jgi:DNA-binding beta-propeller fold protein YncE